jgi:hypothetical protein
VEGYIHLLHKCVCIAEITIPKIHLHLQIHLQKLSIIYSNPTGMCWNGLRRKGTNMERCRIIRGEGCNGCIPIIIYWVQVRKGKRISYEWVNVKGFDTYKRAKELLNVLKGGIDYEQI